MGMTKETRKLAKTLAKGSLYVIGGIAIGKPVIDAVVKVFNGGSLDEAQASLLWNGVGWQQQYGVVPNKAKEIIIRDVLGAVAIIAASKL